MYRQCGLYIHTYSHVYVCTYVRMYVCMYVCMYVRMYICTVNVDRMGQLVPKVSVSVGMFAICSGLCILLQPLVL